MSPSCFLSIHQISQNTGSLKPLDIFAPWKKICIFELTQQNFCFHTLNYHFQFFTVRRSVCKHGLLTAALTFVHEVDEQLFGVMPGTNFSHDKHLRWPLGWTACQWPSPACLAQSLPRCKGFCVHQTDGCNACLPTAHCLSGFGEWCGGRI